MNKLLLYAAVIAVAITAENVIAAACQTVMKPIGSLGDFEIVLDPENEANLLMVANDGEDTSGVPVVVYELNSTTGNYEGNFTTVANAFVGLNRINGPEFMYHRDRGLGVLYAGPDGVHANWRKGGQWGFAVDGHPFSGEPPALPGTEVGRYPSGLVAFGTQTRGEFLTEEQSDGLDLTAAFVGGVADNKMTDLPAELELQRYDLVGIPTFHPGDDGYIVFAACKDNTECAIYEVAIDGHGGIDRLVQLTPFDPIISFVRQCALGIHPITNNPVLFVIGGQQLEVWESTGLHQQMTQIAAFDSLKFRPQHLRVVSSDNALYLHILDKIGRDRGSYLSVYDTSLHEPKFISKHAGGSELVWMPGANSLALFYKEKSKDRLQRCWIDP